MRVIPAYAGSTVARSTSCVSVRDHPRVCGEHVVIMAVVLSVKGSSPRMRGALPPRTVVAGRPRIIPAYAGSTAPVGAPSA